MNDKASQQAAIAVVILSLITACILLYTGRKGVMITLLIGAVLSYLLANSEE